VRFGVRTRVAGSAPAAGCTAAGCTACRSTERAAR